MQATYGITFETKIANDFAMTLLKLPAMTLAQAEKARTFYVFAKPNMAFHVVNLHAE